MRYELEGLRPRRRRGVSATQWCVLAALIVLGIAAGVSSLGTITSGHLHSTATNVGNPSSLPARFGGGGS